MPFQYASYTEIFNLALTRMDAREFKRFLTGLSDNPLGHWTAFQQSLEKAL